MNYPYATYRIQFHAGFTFKDFSRIKSYFKKLGAHFIYASPIFEAVPGSVHGYDVCNPLNINPEIGDLQDLMTLSSWLKEEGMGWLQDIVPNHMAFHPNNTFLMDVLEKGSRSRYQNYFDNVYTRPAMNGRLMVPFLGEKLEEAIANGLLTVKWEGGRLCLNYFKDSYPLKPCSYIFFLEKLKLDHLIQKLYRMDDIQDAESYDHAWEELLHLLKQELSDDVKLKTLDLIIAAANEKKDLLSTLAHEQHYELCFWEDTNHRINYRRFFTVNGLICLNMQQKEVFDIHHQLIKKMVDLSVFNGLRIDHIDGLYEPGAYLQHLRELAGPDTYIIAEKILEKGEEMPVQWPIQGNTGYDFLGMVNNLLTLKSAENSFQQFYEEIDQGQHVKEEEIAKKRYILENHMQGELESLYEFFVKLHLNEKDLNKEELKKAIANLLIYMPVYRLYAEDYPFSAEEEQMLVNLFNTIREKEMGSTIALDELENILLKSASSQQSAVKQKSAIAFFKRCMQFSGPLMAKGVEDTLMYTYFKALNHNEVGDHPSSFGLDADEFHQLMMNRQETTPYTLNATATHDTKRGEDARARLHILTSMPEEWFLKVKHWQHLNAEIRSALGIATHEEYFILQCLVAHFPISGHAGDDFENRMNAYLQKAFREGKQLSDWASPDTSFEDSCVAYVHHLLDNSQPFFADFMQFHKKVARYGAHASLVQTALKFLCPGVPDVYQGTELWDLSFVDPDNRRKVDYEYLAERLNMMENRELNLRELMGDYSSADIKLWLVHQLLQIRNQHQVLFSQGDYIPLQIEGKYKDQLLAFKREVQQQKIICVVLRHPAVLLEEQQLPLHELDWGDTCIDFGKASNWFNLLQLNEGKGDKIYLNDLCLELPLAILKVEEQENTRNAGLLMHISSLPSAYGTGDLGPEAYSFVNFLKRTSQRYWQLLPIGPGAGTDDLSPYSALCSMAANPIFISLEQLVKQGLLPAEALENQQLPVEAQLDFKKASELKYRLLELAWEKAWPAIKGDEQFKQFCAEENHWLKDYSLFMVLRKRFELAWYQWPEELKNRDEAALERVHRDEEQEILKQQWYQYLFHIQWQDFKAYCNQHYVHLIGDLPFYVNHDSSDVWANPQLFKLNQDGSIAGVAGVPPDYFSADGQLWGMPVYRWEERKTELYSWWIKRLKKNIKWFNLLRLDHFRAFYNYWEVPGTAATAISGKWCAGPAADFFDLVKETFPDMPFIAEDLGKVSPGVFELRDKFKLPGMKVLQFAFGEDLPFSPHITHQHQHNFIVYTGTHDNNTIRGWFNHDLNPSDQDRLAAYLGKPLQEEGMAWLMMQEAYASVAKTVIIPIQDLLNMGQDQRMNNPSQPLGNWGFRIGKDALGIAEEDQLQKLTHLYARAV